MKKQKKVKENPSENLASAMTGYANLYVDEDVNNKAEQDINNAPKEEKDVYTLEQAIDKFDPFTEVITSAELLQHQMVLTINEDPTKRKTDINRYSIYIYKPNKKGELCGIPATSKDIEYLKTLKFRCAQLGIPGTSNNNNIYLQDISKSIKGGLPAFVEKRYKKMFTEAANEKKPKQRAEEKAKEIYSHNQDDARKALGYKKPNIFVKIWCKITHTPLEQIEKQRILKLITDKDKQRFPAGNIVFDDIIARYNRTVNETEPLYN